MGEGANIGAGTIFCNYDGFNKHRTDVGEGAFVGSNTSLVAPVKIGDGAYIGSGSVITKNVDAGRAGAGAVRAGGAPRLGGQVPHHDGANARQSLLGIRPETDATEIEVEATYCDLSDILSKR